jgi:hypothetical protein
MVDGRAGGALGQRAEGQGDGLLGGRRTLDPLARHFQAGLQDHNRPPETTRESDLRQRAPASADRDHRIAGRSDRKIAPMADPRDDDVVDPLVRIRATLPGKDPQRGAAGSLRPPRRRSHHLAPTARDDRAAVLGEQAPHLLGSAVVFSAAPDHGHLHRHEARC